MKKLFTICLTLCLFPLVAAAQAPLTTSAKQAIIVDFETGAVLFEKNADERMPTSSMSKVMTMHAVFDAMKNGRISLNDTLEVSEKAWRKGGSKMFVEVNKKVKVEDLVRGVIVQSGNDATIVLAEGLSSSEAAFAELLNENARDLGMNNSHFMNASGWPDPDHYSTAEDLAILAEAIIKNFPEYYKYYSEKEFTYNNITQQNRNPLLYRKIGADGIKTGHTEAGGYGLIGSGIHNGRRVIIVVNGLEDEKARAQESAKLLEWGLQRFHNKQLFKAGDRLEEAAVALGQAETVSAHIGDSLVLTLPKRSEDVQVSAKFLSPIRAPIKKGQEIGTLEVKLPYGEPVTRPLYAGEDVPALGLVGRTFAKAKYFLSNDG
jgi:D-alanyl-D-alanine carboxypeptidase (penicillin-binding protein 5/6)